MTNERDAVDALVVGARPAGSATAIALARAGKRVVVLDRSRFPSDTLSTHLLWPGGLAELRALGALDRVEALGAPRLPIGMAVGEGITLRGRYSTVDGVGYAMCVRRTGLDAALVRTAREAGAQVREGCRVTGLVVRSGRVAGVRFTGRDGTEEELHAPLVVGADGRRSTVARLVGAQRPYRREPSGRACFFGYWTDPRPEWREIAAQWRTGAELGTAFPCDGGLVLCLLQPPQDRAADFRPDTEAEYLRTINAIPGLAERLRGGELVGGIRSATGIESYFRRSSGPGWALPGDAGHFKDPVTAQGIRDALRYGRLLGEAAAPVLHTDRLDAALLDWERRREADCLEVYQWTNGLARGEAMTPLEIELYRSARQRDGLTTLMLDVYSRSRRPGEVATPHRGLALAAAALARPAAGRRTVLAALSRDLRTMVSDALERRAVRRRPLPPTPGLESPRAP
ncbi:NAD(P)/FAD-dependent oxidoreductase [Amycolatopsis cynarae]|uniref:NAD(P)/FAD-dependent oxidoreductase n=1 Tax=Amycolatopsis cynarae TaxID=2995223 RepID=A0ABY7B993_9PSEU|nr:NAD(P)/FAD-dependent oxidoreductase [Amycolatopsis sp. HUAS 11-8]WAL67974.1 NAD(P)/FAD-dependent oxidoreductase [Amycolatopsis sp. HUAS 11-8]